MNNSSRRVPLYRYPRHDRNNHNQTHLRYKWRRLPDRQKFLAFPALTGARSDFVSYAESMAHTGGEFPGCRVKALLFLNGFLPTKFSLAEQVLCESARLSRQQSTAPTACRIAAGNAARL
jgi:hypothetical protein